MISLDVNSPYLLIDIEEMIEIINSKEIAISLTERNKSFLKAKYFKFNENVYKQTKGVPMGSPISGMANIITSARQIV